MPEVVYERNRLHDPAHAPNGGKILCAARRHGDAQFCAAHAGAPLLSASLCRARLRVRPAPCRSFPSSRRNSRPLVDGGALRPLAGSPSFGRILALQAFEAQDDVGKVYPARPCPAPLCLPLPACGIRAAPLFRLAEGAAFPADGSACPFIRGRAGRDFNARLPLPPHRRSAFRSLPFVALFGRGDVLGARRARLLRRFAHGAPACRAAFEKRRRGAPLRRALSPPLPRPRRSPADGGFFRLCVRRPAPYPLRAHRLGALPSPVLPRRDGARRAVCGEHGAHRLHPRRLPCCRHFDHRPARKALPPRQAHAALLPRTDAAAHCHQPQPPRRRGTAV